MRVALFVHCFFPDHFYGTEAYTLAVARNLLAMGHEPVVVSAVFPGEPERESPVTRYDYQELPVYCIDKNRFPLRGRIRNTYYQPEMRHVLRALLQKIEPDIVHVTHLGNHTAVLLDVLGEMKIPAVATFTDFFGFCFTNRLEAADGSLCAGPNRLRTNCVACVLKETGVNHDTKLRYRWLKNHRLALIASRLLRFLHPGKLSELVFDIVDRPDVLARCYAKYRAAIAPTRFLASAYIANGLPVPLHRMHFGIDLPRVRKTPVAAELPLRLGFIGQLAPHKGPDILIEAFCRLPSGIAELHVFGAGKSQDPFVAGLMERAKGRAVLFRGTFPHDRIAEVFADLDILVIPSRWYENSPLVLLSALASHTPVVVSDVEGMAEFVEEGRNGLLFRRGSTDDLERVIRALTEDPTAARAMSANTEYQRSTRDMVSDLVELYASVLTSERVEGARGHVGV